MKKLDGTVKKELRYMLSGLLFFSALLQCVLAILAVFHAFGYRYGLPSLLGCLYTDCIMFADFFLLCLTLQKLVNAEDPARAKLKMRSSSSLRSITKILLVGGGAYLVYYQFTAKSVPDLLSLLLPVLFPRVTIAVRSLILKKQGKR